MSGKFQETYWEHEKKELRFKTKKDGAFVIMT